MARIDQFLKDGMLHRIQQHASYLQQLNQLVQHQLPVELKAHCQVANYKQGTLTLALASGAFVTQIRYQVPQLIQQLKQQSAFSELQKIRCYVATDLLK